MAVRDGTFPLGTWRRDGDAARSHIPPFSMLMVAHFPSKRERSMAHLLLAAAAATAKDLPLRHDARARALERVREVSARVRRSRARGAGTQWKERVYRS